MKILELRIWNKPNKIMYYDVVGVIESNSDGLFVNNSEIMLFSGVEDKYGKKVYDKDIVRIKTWLGLINRVHLVTFQNGAFRIGDAKHSDVLGGYGDIEKIGNIFEDKKLLK